MLLRSSFGSFGVRIVLSKLTGGAIGSMVAILWLWWVVAHVGPQTGNVLIHVTEPGVALNLDGKVSYLADVTDTPIAFDLPAGDHRLTMYRGEEILYTEAFRLARGEERILTAWRQPIPGPIQDSKLKLTGLPKTYP
ncbi:hypothetical protein [Singulisphaera sp. PoT]|uniref:hypothetical protein n=1 Tax=Singulisphaera sp. PoT TaxID=3411797 RepID=UPI003BF4AC0D